MLTTDMLSERRARASTNAHDDLRQLVAFDVQALDRGLPVWARRSHPVVRRHLGAHWKTFTPDFAALVRLYGGLVLATAIAFFIPIIYLMIIPTVTVTLVMLPFTGYLYVRMLYSVIAFAAAAVQSERRGGALDVLRATPYSLRDVLLSKGAAALWRHSEDLALIAVTTLATSLPLLLVLYHAALRDLDMPLVTALVVIAALASVTTRLYLETVMVAAIGMVAGASTPSRPAAVTTSVFVVIAYFALINGARLIPLGAGWIVLIDVVMPLVLPVLITALCLWGARRLLERE